MNKQIFSTPFALALWAILICAPLVYAKGEEKQQIQLNTAAAIAADQI